MFDTPRYDHDCPCCIFLGKEEQYDLYYCRQMGMPTVIARFGPDGDYLSGMSFAVDGSVPVLTTALYRAIHNKLVSINVVDNSQK